jgi:hypothetical protein
MSKAPENCIYCDGKGNGPGSPCGFCAGGKPLDTQEDWDNSWGRLGDKKITSKPLAVIWDRDGTLASVHNAPKTRDKKEWAEYNAALPFDAIVPEIVALLRSIRPGVTNIMVSGRMEGNHPGDRSRRYKLQDWIAKYNLPIDKLYMREGGDQRQDSIVKEEILVNQILPYYNPVMAVDDRDSVVEVWRRYGIYTIHVTNPETLPPIAFQT